MSVMPGRIASADLVGRQGELATLLSALDVVRDTGEPRLVFVGGEAGVGKSRLVEDFAGRVRGSSVQVLVGHCVEISQGDLSFAPIIEAFRAAFSDLSADERESLLGPAAHELARLLPELEPELPQQERVDAGTLGQGRLFEALARILDQTDEREPTVLVIEDLHWADSSTRDFLGFLARSVRAAKILVIATYRSDELHRRHPLRPFVGEMSRLSKAEIIDLRRLSRQGVADQTFGIVGTLPTAALLDRLFTLSEGNPFFVEELIAAGAADEDGPLPRSVSDALMLRLDTVSEQTQEVLRVAAVAGREVHHGLLERVLEVDARSLHQALREAVQSHLLVADRDTYSFRHALLREAVYEDLLPGERIELHRAFVNVLADAPELARGGAAAAAELAYHHHEARDLPAALKASLEAGRAAERTYGFAEAQRHYERALEVWHQVPDAASISGSDEVEVLSLAANAAYLHGELERAVALIRRVVDRIDPAQHPIRAGMAQERLGRYLWVLGRSEESLIAYRKAVEILPADPPSAERARVLAGQAQMLMLGALFTEAMPYAEEAIEMARAVGAVEVVGHALNTLGIAVAYRGDIELGIQDLLESRAIAEDVANYDDIGRSYTNLAEIYAIARRFDEAVAEYREALEVDDRLGLGGTYGVWHHVDLAHILLALGRWDEAEEELGAISHLPFDQAAGMMELAKARLAMWRGDFGAAKASLDSARGYLSSMSQPQGAGPLHVAEAELGLWTKRPLETRRVVERGLAQLEDSEELAYEIVLCWLGLWAEADIVADARATRDQAIIEEAAAIADRLSERAAAHRGGSMILGPAAGPWADGALETIDAEHARLRGEQDLSSWSLATETWDRLDDPFRAAYCRWRLAEASLIAGDRSAAAAALRAAHDTARKLGAGALLDEISALATRGRITLDDEPAVVADDGDLPDPAQRAGLTAREAEVLGLVAQGMTNQQIAETLFISQKTVSVHVSHILEKLGVSSRVEAAGIAHRLGLAVTTGPPP